jgi:hypothetical protein
MIEGIESYAGWDMEHVIGQSSTEWFIIGW